MLCSDTGSHEAIRIPKDVIELAQELAEIIDSIESKGHGQGHISMDVQPGRHIPFIDWGARKFRNRRQRKTT